MAFRRWLIVAPALRKGEPVMDLGLHLQLAWIAQFVKQALQFFYHEQRR